MRLSYTDCGTIGFTCSTFDLLHAGHIQCLKKQNDIVIFPIVGLQTDPTIDRPDSKNPPQSLVERQIQLAAVKYVDEIVCYATEQDLEDLLLTLPINVRVLGVEYKDKQFTGKKICKDRNIKLVFNGRDHSFSSTSLRQRVANHENDS